MGALPTFDPTRMYRALPSLATPLRRIASVAGERLDPANGTRRGEDLVHHEIEVGGRRAVYGVGGEGLPALFLHGWGVGYRTYGETLRRLTSRGCRVYAPSLPGFGGTAGLPASRRNLRGYGDWVDEFLTAVGVEEPAFVLGHSFGGGVAIKLTCDHPRRARYLVLLNAVGGAHAEAGTVRRLTGLPMVDWTLRFARELFPTPAGIGIMRAVSEDFTLNVLHNPRALVEIAALARRADLTGELATLAERQVPVLLLWSDHDRLIPLTSFDTLCAAIGADGRVVDGRHSWLIADPDALGEVLENILQVQVAQHDSSEATASGAEIKRLLGRTRVPRRVVARLVDGASPLWMMSDRPAVLAADLALCHPPLKRGELRAVARPLETSASCRLTVVAHDRPGLLADTAAVLAAERLSARSASAVTWERDGLALHALTFDSETVVDAQRWESLGRKLQEMAGGRPSLRFVPSGRATVTSSGPTDRAVIRVSAPDQIGLLWAICRWFADHGVSIEAASATTTGSLAKDAFVVTGTVDTAALAAHLSRTGSSMCEQIGAAATSLITARRR